MNNNINNDLNNDIMEEKYDQELFDLIMVMICEIIGEDYQAKKTRFLEVMEHKGNDHTETIFVLYDDDDIVEV
jgi:hypothetical protein